MKKRNIVVPLDGSDFSRRILCHIRATFDPETTCLHLIHVADYPVGHLAVPTYPASVEYMDVPYFESSRDVIRSNHPIYPAQEEESMLSFLRQQLQADSRSLQRDGYEVVEAVRFGEASDEIVTYAEGIDAQVIAMTTHGRTGLARLLFGSVAEQIVGASSIPVMLLRPFAKSD